MFILGDLNGHSISQNEINPIWTRYVFFKKIIQAQFIITNFAALYNVFEPKIFLLMKRVANFDVFSALWKPT